MKKETTAAVIVTCNRKNDLQKCLNSILSQTKKLTLIIIIDNHSTDGTKELVEKHYLKNSLFKYIYLNENVGSAGGFYEGVKSAYESGFDWVWLLDDDVLLEKNTFEELVKYKTENTVLNSLVIDSEDTKRLSRKLEDVEKQKIFLNVKDCPDIIKGITPTLGTLISRETIQKIGFHRKDFFVWGDEKEYFLRMLKNKLNFVTVKKSKIYHPGFSKENYKTFLGKQLLVNLPNWKLYYYIRNNFVINRLYFNLFKRIYRHFLFFSYFFICLSHSKDKIGFSKAFWYGTLHAITNRMGRFDKAFTF